MITQEMAERWKDFAVRMARTCFKDSRRPSAAWIESHALELIESFGDVSMILDWSNADTWPEGHQYHNVDRYGRAERAGLPCDMASYFWDGEFRYVVGQVECKACRRSHLMVDRPEQECVCDQLEDDVYESWLEQWAGPVNCCVRAGLDAVTGESGVIGFTAGDVRAMYPEAVPDWMFPDGLVVARLGADPAEEPAVPFAEVPDGVGVWL